MAARYVDPVTLLAQERARAIAAGIAKAEQTVSDADDRELRTQERLTAAQAQVATLTPLLEAAQQEATDARAWLAAWKAVV